MRTNVYIDGGNLYHGLLRYHPELKWLDLEKFDRTSVVVFNPRNCKSDLMYHANYYRTIPADLAALCQLPDTLKVGSRTFVRPSAWAKSATPEC